MWWPRIKYKKYIELEDIVKVGDYVYRLDKVISDEYKITRLQVIDIKTEEKETSEEDYPYIFIFNDKILTLSDRTTYKMSHLIYRANIYEDLNIRWHLYNKNYPDIKIFLTKELAYNYLYWLSYDKSVQYKNALLQAQHQFNIWDNKEKLYRKYKDLKTEKRFIDYEERKFNSRTIHDSEPDSNS